MPTPVLPPGGIYNPFNNPGVTNPFARPPASFNNAKKEVRASMPGLANVADSVLNSANSVATLGLGGSGFKDFITSSGKDIVVYGIAILFIVFGLKGIFK